MTDGRIAPGRTDSLSVKLLSALAGLSGIAPLATDMYVPGLPSVARDLHADTASVQLSLTCFLVGMISGQLILGPLSDQVGRRPVLIWGTALFAAASALCVVAPTISIFNSLRFAQGFAGAAGVVVARAVVTDLHDGDAAARIYGRLGAITAAAPVVAPLLGGAILELASWRWTFLGLSVLGLVLVTTVWRWVPESLPLLTRSRGGVLVGFKTIGALAVRPAVAAPVLVVGFGGATIFAYIASNTFIFHDLYGMSGGAVSVVYGVNAVGNMMGSMAYSVAVRRWRAVALAVLSSAVAVAASCLLAATALLGIDSMGCTWALLFVIVTSFGVIFPAALTTAQHRGREAPGATSALVGGAQFILGAVSSPLVGAFGTDSLIPLAVLVTTALVLCCCAATVCMRGERADVE